MKFLHSLLLLTCSTVFSPTLLFAGDAAKLHFLGFSESGKFLAFQEYGKEEGSGEAYANLYFIDVEGNKYASKSITTRSHTSASETAIRQTNLEQATDPLKKLGIVADNQGTPVVTHLLTDIGVDSKTVKFTMGVPLAGSSYSTYAITVAEIADLSQECASLGETKMLTLTLKNEGEKKTSMLQKDTHIPKSRGCALGYRIQEVFVYREKYLVIFLNVFLPGFEGQNLRYLAITGTLN